MAIENILLALFYVLIFPGLWFLATYGMTLEWVDRKLGAVLQNRVGPPWYQPAADFVKLVSKEVIIPQASDGVMFRNLPFFAVAGVTAAMMMIPVWNGALFAFEGDLVVAIYLLTIPTVTFFLAGWSSTSPYAAIGAIRVMTQLFSYEVPLMLALLGPAILAGTWNITAISEFFTRNPAYMPAQLAGFIVAILALQGKLERLPFDSPHAKTEIVGGQFTEYTGRLLAFFHTAVSMEMVVGAALINAVFLGGGLGLTGVAAFLLFMLKTFAVVLLLIVLRVLMARIRIEQMIKFCWQILAPLAMAQIVFDIFLRVRLG